VDEAHAIGVLGPGGSGISASAAEQLPEDNLIMIGTLSKALGSYGGFAAGSKRMKEFLINSARSFIFSTALPPACAAGAREAVRILREDRETDAVPAGKLLLNRADAFRRKLHRAGFETGPSTTHIIPLMVGDNEKAVAFSHRLSEAGIEAVAVRPPTVPPGTARLRLSLTLAHQENDLAFALDRLIHAAGKTGGTP
jgi:8-amino-7-oxononanoate synthase